MSLVPNETQQALNAQREAFVASIEVFRQKINEQADRIAQLEAALRMWEAAVNINVTMEGPRYMGVNSTAGRKAWELTRSALGGENER